MLAFSAIKGGDRVGLVMVSDRVERIVLPRKGEKHVMRVTREVLGAEPTGRKTDPRSGSRRSPASPSDGALRFSSLISSSPGIVRASSGCSRSRPRSTTSSRWSSSIRAMDELPDLGLAMLEDLESGEEVLVDTSDSRVRAAYTKAARARRNAIRSVFKRLAVDNVIVRTDGSM